MKGLIALSQRILRVVSDFKSTSIIFNQAKYCTYERNLAFDSHENLYTLDKYRISYDVLFLGVVRFWGNVGGAF